MTDKYRPSDRLALVEDQLLEVLGSDFDLYRQSLEARRRIKWAHQWLVLAGGQVGDDSRALMGEAARHLRKAIDAIEKADENAETVFNQKEAA